MEGQFSIEIMQSYIKNELYSLHDSVHEIFVVASEYSFVVTAGVLCTFMIFLSHKMQ